MPLKRFCKNHSPQSVLSTRETWVRPISMQESESVGTLSQPLNCMTTMKQNGRVSDSNGNTCQSGRYLPHRFFHFIARRIFTCYFWHKIIIYPSRPIPGNTPEDKDECSLDVIHEHCFKCSLGVCYIDGCSLTSRIQAASIYPGRCHERLMDF